MPRLEKSNETTLKGFLAGGALAAIGVSLCCLGPLALVSLGLGGAWVAHLTALEPYRPLFLGVAAVVLVLAYRRLYRSGGEETSCASGTPCTAPRAQRLYKGLFWAVAVLVLLSGATPYIAPLFY
ncbi:mercuric transporter MerT family protein [Pelomicrobium sp.]|uniref:mercuric transporter MerT family protein n=1 Tax=Pelomicrobium sp. TaxID=2815319 RepID=UPI002FDDE383